MKQFFSGIYYKLCGVFNTIKSYLTGKIKLRLRVLINEKLRAAEIEYVNLANKRELEDLKASGWETYNLNLGINICNSYNIPLYTYCINSKKKIIDKVEAKSKTLVLLSEDKYPDARCIVDLTGGNGMMLQYYPDGFTKETPGTAIMAIEQAAAWTKYHKYYIENYTTDGEIKYLNSLVNHNNNLLDIDNY